jgi:hypothetical protein
MSFVSEDYLVCISDADQDLIISHFTLAALIGDGTGRADVRVDPLQAYLTIRRDPPTPEPPHDGEHVEFGNLARAPAFNVDMPLSDLG